MKYLKNGIYHFREIKFHFIEVSQDSIYAIEVIKTILLPNIF
jgi:hypothetical protein